MPLKENETSGAVREADISKELEMKSEKQQGQQKEKQIQHNEELPPIPLPFPQRMVQSKKLVEASQEKEILEIFQKVEINIPLLDAIKQMPKYAKFFKKMCTHRRKLKGNERVNVSKNV